MDREVVSGIKSTLLLIGILTLALNIQSVKAYGTIYIRASGVVEGTDKIQREGDYYTFTDNIYDSMIIEKDNIVVDGAGYTSQGGTRSIAGIDLSYRKNVTIKNMEIKRYSFGIKLDQSNYNTISGNNITENGQGIKLSSSDNNIISWNNIAASEAYGIEVFYSSNNNIYGNNIANSQQLGIMLSASSDNNNLCHNKITNNGFGGIRLHSSLKNIVSGNTVTGHIYGFGIKLEYSSNYTLSGNNIANNQVGFELEYSSKHNRIIGNNITNNEDGIWLWNSSANLIYHNNFLNNEVQEATSIPYLANNWDNGYPSGGNFWSDYADVDLRSGPFQNRTGGDGIGDSPYIIDNNNQDRYPSMSQWDTILPAVNAGEDRTVGVGETISFDASASSDNVGIVAYQWCFGDETSGVGITTTHKYTNAGTYRVTLTVEDATGNQATDTMTVEVLSAEVFPIWIMAAAGVAAVGIAAAAIILWKRRKGT